MKSWFWNLSDIALFVVIYAGARLSAEKLEGMWLAFSLLIVVFSASLLGVWMTRR